MQQIYFQLDSQLATIALTKHYQKNRLQKTVFIRLFFLWLFCLAVLLLVIFLIDGVSWLQSWGKSLVNVAILYALIIMVMWALHTFVFLPYFSKLYVNRYPALLQNQHWSWNKRQMAIDNAFIKTYFNFSQLYAYYEYKTHIAFYISAEKFSILPKSALDEKQLHDLRLILAQEVKNTR